MKQSSTHELGRQLSGDEKKVLTLEKSYMEEFNKFFQHDEFIENLYKVENYVQNNYEFLDRNYDKKNKIDIAIERLLRFHIYKNYKGINGIYPSPISSDIAFETNDAIINLDSKTLDIIGNRSDFNYFHFKGNQSSFKNYPLGKTDYYEGCLIKTTLPVVSPQSNKPSLTYVVRIVYRDDRASFSLYKDEQQNNITLTCLPNGLLSKLFNNNIIQNCKTFLYHKDGILSPKKIAGRKKLELESINLGTDYDSFETFKSDIIKSGFTIPDGWKKQIKILDRYGFYDSINDIGWVPVDRDWKKNNHLSRYNFEAVISGSNYRTNYSTLLNRLDQDNKSWKGHTGWNLS